MATNELQPSLEELESEGTPVNTTETETKTTITELDKTPELTPKETETPKEEEEQEKEKEEEEKEDEGKKKEEEEKDPEDPEEGEEDEEVEAFFDGLSEEGLDVREMEIDFEGADPLSPKGIKKIIAANEDLAIGKFDAYLKNLYPGAYAHLLAAQSGVSDEEFFKGEEYRVPLVPTEQEVSDSEDIQKELIRKDLLDKGFKESRVEKLIEQIAEDDELLSEALEVRKGKEEERNSKLEKLAKSADEKIAAEVELNKQISSQLASVMQSGKITKDFVIPKEDRKKSVEEFQNNLRVENGKLFLVQEVEIDNIPQALGKAYVGNKSNLDKIVEKKTTTKLAVRARAAADSERTSGGKSKKAASKQGGGFTPLDDIN